jgi:hypothetical protein
MRTGYQGYSRRQAWTLSGSRAFSKSEDGGLEVIRVSVRFSGGTITSRDLFHAYVPYRPYRL